MKSIIYRDLKLAFSNLGQIFNQLVFFFIAITIFAISFKNSALENQSNSQISVIWFCLIFSVIIGISNFLKEDFLDGSLEQILINHPNLEIIILAKIIANWLIYSLPLIIFLPLAALILKIDLLSIQSLIALALIVTLLVNLISCFCASLTLSCNKNESLLTILILPLIIPVVIFANSAFINTDPTKFFNSLFFLVLILIFLAPILIFLTSFAVKISVEQ